MATQSSLPRAAPIPLPNLGILGDFNKNYRITSISSKDVIDTHNDDPLLRFAATGRILQELVLHHCRCSPMIDQLLSIRSFQTNWLAIARYARSNDGPFDFQFHQVLGCLIESLITQGQTPGSTQSTLSGQELTIRPIRIDPGPMETNVYGYRDLLILKTSQDFSDLGREALIGMLAINPLRRFIPNFVHTYAVTDCASSVPIGNRVIGFCAEQGFHHLYVYQEFIQGVDLHTYMANRIIPVEVIARIYLQVVNAINLASSSFGFTHYDLNARNILIQELDSTITIPIYHNGNISYLPTTQLARIIDFGLSHIDLGVISLGKEGLTQYGIYPNLSYPITDAYRACLTMAILDQNPQNWSFYQSILQLIDPSVSLDQRIAKPRRADDYFMAPLGLTLTINQLVGSLITDLVPHLVITNELYPVGLIVDQPDEKLFFRNRLPRTILEYYTCLTGGSKTTYHSAILDWLSSVSLKNLYWSDLASYLVQIERMANELGDVVDDPVLSTDDLEKIIDGQTLVFKIAQFLTMATNLLVVDDSLTDFVNQLKAILNEAVNRVKMNSFTGEQAKLVQLIII